MSAFDIYMGDGGDHSDRVADIGESVVHAERGKYLADPELVEAVNLSIAVGQPLLVTGEPGCGKTVLAWSVAKELGLGDPLVFQTRSSARARDLLYRFDSVLRFHDIQADVKDEGVSRAANPWNYVRFEALGQAIRGDERRVVLIDEVDKAPRDFPNDLLRELDRMEFEVPELPQGERHFSASQRPIVIITSNTERQLPLPFLRRCVFHHIQFPSRDKLQAILKERLGDDGPPDALIEAAVAKFDRVRRIAGLVKPPATGELLAWAHGLHVRGLDAAAVRDVALARIPLWQALLKDRDDHARLLGAT